MQIYKYNKVLEDILGKQEYNRLINNLNNKVKEKFGRQHRHIEKKIVYANTVAILIISILKVGDTNKCKNLRHLKVNSLQSNEYLVKKDIDEFINEFSEYINLIVKKLKGA